LPGSERSADRRREVLRLRRRDPLLIRETAGRVREIALRRDRVLEDDLIPRERLLLIRELARGRLPGVSHSHLLNARLREQNAVPAERLRLPDQTGADREQHVRYVRVIERREIGRELR